MLNDELYTEMMENEEMWFVCGPGVAILIYDTPLLDS